MNQASVDNPYPVQSSIRDTFSRGEWWFFWSLIAAGLLLRWIGLDWRPYHHDESLHGMYGKYYFDFPDVNYYRYQALLHGPFLYNMLRAVYATLGENNWGARAPMALVGSALMFAPLCFRRYLSPTTLLALTAAVSLSPTLVYWSRFLREDILIVACMVGMLYGATVASGPRRALIVLLTLCLQFCIKENAYVLLAILLGYIFFEAYVSGVLLKDRNFLLLQLIRHCRKYWLAVLNSLALAVFVYCYLYSAGFRYAKGILDGLYRESLVYWLHQHNIDRISGPFLFHFYMLSWYESLFIVAFLLYLWSFYRSADVWTRTIGALFLISGLIVSLSISGTPITQYRLANLLKLKDSLDVFAFFILVPQSVIATVKHLLERDRQLAFFGYLFLANLATYSYLGEKVPWLTSYPFVTGLVYLALYFQRRWIGTSLGREGYFAVSSILRYAGVVAIILGLLFIIEEGNPQSLPWVWFGIAAVAAGIAFERSGSLGRVNAKYFLFAVFCIYTLRASILTNFVYAGESREYISQVHTTKQFHEISETIRKEIELQIEGYKPKILVLGDSTWPMTWYMRDIPEYKFQAPPADYPKFDYIIQNWAENKTPEPANFRYQRINLRGWWVPELKQMTLRKFLAYALNHTPWSPVGYSYAWLQVNPNSPAN